MAKKKSGASKSKRKPAKRAKKAPAKKTAAKKKTARKTAPKKKTAKKAVRKKTRKKAAKKTLGKPRVPAKSHLDDLFRKDVQAREVFEYLRVTTLRELEEHTPQEIIDRMTRPVVQTVDRIRKALALSNRCLAGDEKFAIEFHDRIAGQR